MTQLRTRRSIEDEIERLIAALDLMDADSDLEETGDDEFSCGWQNEGSQRHLHFGHDNREPDLGFAGIATGWREGEQCEDREDENEHRDESDYEESEGWPEQYSQGADNSMLHMTGTDNGYREPPPTTQFTGSGVAVAKELLSGKKRRRPQFVPNYSERPVLEPNKPSYAPIYELKASDFDRLPWA